MDTIKVSINVSIDFSENVKTFFSSLFNSSSNAAANEPKAQVPSVKVEKAATEVKPQVAPAKAAQASSSNIKIDQVRKVLAEKVVDHRAAIKAKLEELGAPSVTKLDPAKYEEMYNFLTEL